MSEKEKPQFGVRLEGEELENFNKEFKAKDTQPADQDQQFGVLPLDSSALNTDSSESTFTNAPQGSYDSLEKPTPPEKIKYAWWAWLGLQAITAISMIYMYTQLPKFMEEQKQQMYEEAKAQNVSVEQIDSALKVVIPAFIIMSALALMLAIWLGYKMYQGRNWARVLLTFFCVFQVISVFFAFTSVSAMSALVILEAVLAAAALYMMRSHDGQKYFARIAEYRARKKFGR